MSEYMAILFPLPRLSGHHHDRGAEKLADLRLQLPDFQRRTLARIANELVLDVIQDKMRKNNVSDKIVHNTVIDDVHVRRKTARITIKSEYFSESGFDVAYAREKGTRRHFVEPKVSGHRADGHGTELTNQTTAVNYEFQRNHPRALHWIEQGQSRFSKGHWVKGMPKLHTIRRTIRENKKQVQEQYQKELREWIKTFGL